MSNALRNLFDIALFAIAMIFIISTIHYCSREAEVVEKEIIKHDTTVIEVVDTITYYSPRVFTLLPVHDTIVKATWRTDTIEVEVPKVTKVYEDSTYRCQVSGGYFADLDYIKVFPKRIYLTMHEIEKRKPKFVVSLGVTAGYDPCYNRVSCMVGIHAGIPIWSYYGKR